MERINNKDIDKLHRLVCRYIIISLHRCSINIQDMKKQMFYYEYLKFCHDFASMGLCSNSIEDRARNFLRMQLQIYSLISDLCPLSNLFPVTCLIFNSDILVSQLGC